MHKLRTKKTLEKLYPFRCPLPVKPHYLENLPSSKLNHSLSQKMTHCYLKKGF